MLVDICFLLIVACIVGSYLLFSRFPGSRLFAKRKKSLEKSHAKSNTPPIYATKRHPPPHVVKKSLAWYLDPKNRYYDAKPILPMQLLDTSDLVYDSYLLGPGIETLRNLREYRNLATLLESNAFHPSKLAR